MVSYAAGDTVAAAFLLLCVSGVMASAVNTVVRLIFGRGGGLCRTLMKRGLTVFIALLFSSIGTSLLPAAHSADPGGCSVSGDQHGLSAEQGCSAVRGGRPSAARLR